MHQENYGLCPCCSREGSEGTRYMDDTVEWYCPCGQYWEVSWVGGLRRVGAMWR
jgi:hypothetical protein